HSSLGVVSMFSLSFLLLYSLTLINADHNITSTGNPKKEDKMSTMTIVAIAGGSILFVVAVLLLVVFLVIRPMIKKKKAYKKREAEVLQALPNLKLTRTGEEPEVHSVERIS
ncbi:hypothetical protein PMAYCL1PPCAC_28984, partial [Pristionchus mayeri]